MKYGMSSPGRQSSSAFEMKGSSPEMRVWERGMDLKGMTPRRQSSPMRRMSQGMTERRAIGMNRMSQEVPGIGNKKKASGQPSKTPRRRSAGMGM